MTSYGSLYIKNKLVRSTVEDLDWFTNLIFHTTDAKVYEQEYRKDHPNPFLHTEEKHVLSSRAGILLERLNVLGFSEEEMKSNFEAMRQYRIKELSFLIDYHDTMETSNHIKERKFWKKYDLNDFLESIHKLVHEPDLKIKKSSYERIYSNTFNYIIDKDYDLLEALPFSNDLFSLRAFLTVVAPDTLVVFDYTDLYDAEIFTDEDVINPKEPHERIIVLTEGTSDIAILKPALQLLYPHLYEFYSFFDFESFNSQGGSGNLVNMIKSFAGAGISNKIIALFDNDTAAREAQATLKELSLPHHIKILNYPYISFAENYPTLGPTGLNFMNINGLACSIELYLGEDVLKEINGELLPILWKGYSPKMQAYQGEIMSKREIQKRYLQKLAACKASDQVSNHQNWNGIISIFEMMFDGFNSEKNNYQSVLKRESS
nr:HEPN/Toprim-associated domain-containing protein [Pedobacter hiemivivus]